MLTTVEQIARERGVETSSPVSTVRAPSRVTARGRVARDTGDAV